LELIDINRLGDIAQGRRTHGSSLDGVKPAGSNNNRPLSLHVLRAALDSGRPRETPSMTTRPEFRGR
jgi:hypothetical protein